MALSLKRHSSASPPQPLQSAALDDRFFTDFYLQLLTSSWPALLLQIVGAFVVINLIFALGYYIDGAIENARPDHFSDYFFFSVQTIATIGYGKLSPTDLFSQILMSVEAVTGLINFALITGLIFAKFSRPTARILFSRVAVVGPYNGRPTLSFRLANQRRNQILQAEVAATLVRDERTEEGVLIRRFYDLPLARYRSPIFALTFTVMHEIDRDSPLYGASAASLEAQNAELVVTATGIDETIAQRVHARTSYLPDEILWGHRFADVIGWTEDGSRVIDYRRFHDTVPLRAAP